MRSWQRKPRVPLGMREWPDRMHSLQPHDVVDMYDRGFAGAIHDAEARDDLFNSVDFPDGDDACYKFGIVGTGEGKLSIPFMHAVEHYPNAIPSPNQTTGDCVSHAGKNCGLGELGVEAALMMLSGDGHTFGFPEVSAEAQLNGVVASENLYGMRGHTGQGASCEVLQKYATTTGGIMLRQNYPDLSVDLTKYDAQIGINWGGRGTPDAVNKVANQHAFATATDATNWEVARDLSNNGYMLWVCSGFSFSDVRDANGFSPQTPKGWGHSWVIGGIDDRPETKAKYGFPLAWFIHDWYKWNSGGTLILGTNLNIPEGTMWINATLLDKCDVTGMSKLNGFPRRNLPSWSWGLK